MKKHTRKDRVSQLIQMELAKILQHEMEDKRMRLVTILDVEATSDFEHAKIFVSVLSDDSAEIADIVRTLNDSAKALRFRLAQVVLFRKTPQLKFLYDDSIVKGSRLSSLINTLTQHDENDEE